MKGKPLVKKLLDAHLYHSSKLCGNETRNIGVLLPAYQLDALKEKHVNISAVVRCAVKEAYEAVS